MKTTNKTNKVNFKAASKKPAKTAVVELRDRIAEAFTPAEALELKLEQKPAKKLSARDLKSLAKKAAIEAAAKKPLPAEKPAAKKDGKLWIEGADMQEARKRVTPTKLKTAKPAAKKADKAPKAPKEIVLKVRLYAKGEFYFGKHSAVRIGKFTHMDLSAKGKTITLTPTNSEKGYKLMYCHAAPVLRAKEFFKARGMETLTTQDMVAKPVGDNGFAVEVQ